MTAKPVPEHISDDLTALERLRLHVHDHEIFPFSTEDAEEILEEYEVALTELQHRREAEAETREGWKLIPRRPTEDMMQAGNYQSSHDSTSADVYSAWVDMWDAAPSPDEYENPSKLERKTLAASPSSPASGVRVKAPKNLNDEISNMLDEHDLTQVLQDSLHEDIAQLVWSALNASGNYVADHDTYPKEVHFSNGRVVKLSANGAYLIVSSEPLSALGEHP